MSQVKKRLARVVRDLLEYDESIVILGRNNINYEDFGELLIVIDTLTSTAVGNTPSYDGESEVHNYSSLYASPCTINVYGNNASGIADRLVQLIQSEKCKDLQYQHQITVYNATSITDLGFLAGSQYNERYEIALNAQLTKSVDVETLRIDTPVFQFLNSQ